MVHEKQIRNEESAALLNQNMETGIVPRVSKRPPYKYAACLRAVLSPCLKERRLLEILAPMFNYFPVFTKYFYSFNPKH